MNKIIKLIGLISELLVEIQTLIELLKILKDDEEHDD